MNMTHAERLNQLRNELIAGATEHGAPTVEDIIAIASTFYHRGYANGYNSAIDVTKK